MLAGWLNIAKLLHKVLHTNVDKVGHENWNLMKGAGRLKPPFPFHPWTKVTGFSGFLL
jgi:hypothetical protein